MWTTLTQLPRTIWLMGLISLVNDTASNMVYPLIPLYLASVLMAGPKTLGLIEGIAEATSSLLKLFAGVVIDRTRRSTPWIVFGYALAGFSRPMIALISSWPGLLLIRFADRVGKGLRTSPRDALLARSIAPEHRGLAFGLHRAMDNAGAVVGPLLAAGLLGLGVGLRELFLFTLLPALLCLGLSLALREPPAPARPTPGHRFDWQLQRLPPTFRRYLLALALFTLGNSSNMFLLLRARELGLSEAQVPLAWAAVSAVATVFATPLAAWSDRWGRRRLIVAGWLAYASFYLALGWSGSTAPLTLMALFAGYGLFLAATEGVEKALVADLAPAEQLGTAYGWFNLTTGAMLLPASLLFGLLYEYGGAGVAFTVSAACAMGGILLLPTSLAAPARPRSPKK